MSNPFHDHLDACERCRENPFNLCPTGDALLVAAALGPASALSAAADVAQVIDETKRRKLR